MATLTAHSSRHILAESAVPVASSASCYDSPENVGVLTLVVATVKKPDWAERKARQWEQRKRGQRVLIALEIAALLRQERRRAVRACKQVNNPSNLRGCVPDYCAGYMRACADCARAIGGK